MRDMDEVVLLIGFGINFAILSIVIYALAAIYLTPL